MVGINFGGFDVIGGKNVSSGIASGLDTKAIVESLVDAKRIPITKLEDRVELNSKKLSAYSEFTKLLSSFQDSVEAMRKSPYFGDQTTDVFQKKQVYVNSSDGNPAATYVGISAENTAITNKYQIKVTNLAVEKSQISGAFASKSTSVTESAAGVTLGKFKAGTFKINDVDITLTEGDSLINIAAHINAVSTETGVVAGIVKVSDTDYRLVLKSEQAGTDDAYIITDASSILSNITFTVTNAEDATITFDGVAITRTSNVIDDIVDGVTFSLYQETPTGVTLSTEIATNHSSILAEITSFVGKYNDLKMFAARQTERDPITGNFTEDAVLGSDAILRETMTNIFTEISNTFSGIDDDYCKLSDIGITFEDFDGDDENPATRNIMSIDSISLQTAIEKDSDALRRLFEFDFNSSSENIMVSKRSNALSVQEFTLDIDTSRAAGTEVKVTYEISGITYNIYATYESSSAGGKIIGLQGTVIEGLEMYYAGDGTDIINVTATQGIADRVYNILESLINNKDGAITLASDSVLSKNTDTNEEIVKLESQIDGYRDRLLRQYSAIETAIAKVNSVLQLLDAQMRAQDAYGR